MMLYNRADGVDGHYCIGRYIDCSMIVEFWNKGFWSSAGQVFTNKAVAEFVLNQLKQVDQLSDCKGVQ